MTVPLTFELGWRGHDAGEQVEPAKQPLPLKRISLDRASVGDPAEVDAA